MRSIPDENALVLEVDIGDAQFVAETHDSVGFNTAGSSA